MNEEDDIVVEGERLPEQNWVLIQDTNCPGASSGVAEGDNLGRRVAGAVGGVAGAAMGAASGNPGMIQPGRVLGGLAADQGYHIPGDAAYWWDNYMNDTWAAAQDFSRERNNGGPGAALLFGSRPYPVYPQRCR